MRIDRKIAASLLLLAALAGLAAAPGCAAEGAGDRAAAFAPLGERAAERDPAERTETGPAATGQAGETRADPTGETRTDPTGETAPETPPAVGARAAVLLGPEGQAIWERDAHARLPIASCTKLMTALVVAESCDLSEEVRIPADCCGIEGSSMELRPGERCSVGELLYGLLLVSGNDAAQALACHCAGSAEAFSRRMNDKARELGLTDSCFVTPHGLPAEGQYGSAADLGRLMLRCMEVPELSEILGTCQIQIRDRALRNHLRLLWTLPGCLGGKTGYTRASGRCLVSCCEREGTRLVCVTLDDADDWNDHAALYDWGFARYARRDLTGELRWTLPVIGGDVAETEARADVLERFLPRDAELRFEAELPPFLFAPARAGEVCGRVRALRGGEELGSVPIRLTEDISPRAAGQ